jgi:hypothetical protein
MFGLATFQTNVMGNFGCFCFFKRTAIITHPEASNNKQKERGQQHRHRTPKSELQKFKIKKKKKREKTMKLTKCTQ